MLHTFLKWMTQLTNRKGTLNIHQIFQNEFKYVVKQTKKSKPILKRKKFRFKKFLFNFLKESGIHGLSYLAKQKLHSTERFLFWLIFIIASIFFCIHFGFRSLDRYKNASTVVSIEKDFFFWRTTTPSITICPLQRLNRTLFEVYAKFNNISSKDNKEDLFQFLESLANSTYANFKDIKIFPGLENFKINPYDYMWLIFNLTGNNLYNSNDSLRIHTKSGSFKLNTRQVLTEFGLCYTTNNLLSDNVSTETLIFGKDPSTKEIITYTNPEDKLLKKDVTQADIRYSLTGFSSDFLAVYIHSPLEVMPIHSNYFLRSTEDVQFYVHTLEILTEEDFETETLISQRRCRFPHESNLTHFGVYTKNICYEECRLEAAFILCKCIPHFYPNPEKTKRVCNYTELITCFPKYVEKFLHLHFQNITGLEGFQCYCLQNCRESRVLLTKTRINHGIGALLTSKGATVIVDKYANTRYMRKVIFTFEDFLVSIGATAGFFLGVSVLSAIEVIYYFTLRLFWYVMENK